MVLVKKGWKPSRILVAALLGFATFIPVLNANQAAAYSQMGNRSITLSDSTPGATDVIYSVSLLTGSASNLGGLVIEFCANTPIIQDACTAPTDFDLTLSGLALANQTHGFAIDGTNSTTSKLVLTRTPTAVTAGTLVTVDLGTENGDGVENPSTTGSFYARVVTYATAANAQGYLTTDVDNDGPAIDAGGIALSTAEQITVTAKVQERLTFCVYTSDGGGNTNYDDNDCTAQTGTAVILGDTNGVLDTDDAYVSKDARYSVSTNASGNVAIRVKGPTLTSGSNTIDALTTSAQVQADTEQFGICTYEIAGGAGNLAAHDDYDGDNAGTDASICEGTTNTAETGTPGGDNDAYFRFNTANTESTYGDIIATKEPGNFSTGSLVMMGIVSNTTEAGIYITDLIFIATGTY